MKKILATIFASTALFFNVANADVSGFGVGITVSNNDLDTTVTDDIDSNGSIDTTKNLSDKVTAGSIFGELTRVAPSGVLALTLGVDYIPVDAELDKRSTTQSRLEAKGGAAASSGTNSGEATIEDHITLYVQPGYLLNENTMLYGTLGRVRADISAKAVSVSSTDFTKVQTLDGFVYGIGAKHVRDNGIFIKLDYKQTDYDAVSYTTSNSTKVTGDIDNTALSLSVGKSF
jgi:opacity protein-like surface antigen